METDYFDGEKDAVRRYMENYDELQGVFGREKIDPVIVDIIERINTNPNAFSWGESCQGHVTAYFSRGVRKPHLGPGYLGLALRSRDEITSKHFGDLERLSAENPLLKVSFKDEPIILGGERVASYPLVFVQIGESKYSNDVSELRSLFGKYLETWNSVSSIINAHL